MALPFLYADISGTVQEMDTTARHKRLWSVEGAGEPVSAYCLAARMVGRPCGATKWEPWRAYCVVRARRSLIFGPHSGSVTALVCDAAQRTLVTGSSRPALAEWLGDGGVQVCGISMRTSAPK